MQVVIQLMLFRNSFFRTALFVPAEWLYVMVLSPVWGMYPDIQSRAQRRQYLNHEWRISGYFLSTGDVTNVYYVVASLFLNNINWITTCMCTANILWYWAAQGFGLCLFYCGISRVIHVRILAKHTVYYNPWAGQIGLDIALSHCKCRLIGAHGVP